MDADAVVIGAGVVGLACARELAARGRDVVIIERHERFGVETSSRNSEVIHAGIYYPAGSLKARLCVAGSRRLYAWCRDRDVPHARIGKLIVAGTADEEPRLDEILRQAEANGVSSLRPLSAADVRALEPHVRATRGLWSPDTGIVDSHQLMASLLADAEGRGGTAAWRHEVVGADPLRGGGFGVTARSDGETTRIEARTVVNAAGLDADLVAAYPGLNARAAGYALHFARGHYFRVSRARRTWPGTSSTRRRACPTSASTSPWTSRAASGWGRTPSTCRSGCRTTRSRPRSATRSTPPPPATSKASSRRTSRPTWRASGPSSRDRASRSGTS